MSTSMRGKKSVLITGCSAGGLGEALAKEFHARGLRVFATARNQDSMQTLRNSGIETATLDVTHPESVMKVKDWVAEATGGDLDILLNNAGISYPYAAADVDMDKVKQLFDVNLFAAMTMVQSFLPLLLKSNNARIVHMGSLAGVMPVPFGAAYNASKAALHAYNDTLRVELAPFNIKVINVVLGNVQTNLSKPWHVLPEGSIYQPIKQEYQARRIDNFQASAVPREPIAQMIVNETLKTSPRAWLWGGANSLLVWLISTFLSRTGFDSLLSRMFGLTKLFEIRKREDKKHI